MDVRVDEILLLMSVNGHQVSLILGSTGCLSSLKVLKLINVLETLSVSVSSPSMWARILVFDL